MADESRVGNTVTDSGTVEGVAEFATGRLLAIIEDFRDPTQEWRRLFSELLGTFMLVLVAAGGGMMGQAFPNTISRTAAVVAPGLMVLAIILFMGKVSGAHLNPAVSVLLRCGGISRGGGSPATSWSSSPALCSAPGSYRRSFTYRPRTGRTIPRAHTLLLTRSRWRRSLRSAS